jgi:hypothetical protein
MILKLYNILLLLFLMFSSSYSYIHKNKPSLSLVRCHIFDTSYSKPTFTSNLRCITVIVRKRKK